MNVDESNLYAKQNDMKFHTNEQQIKAVLRIIYITSLNKLPKIKILWECKQFICTQAIRNAMARSKFEDIDQNLNFLGNIKDDKSDKGYKFRSLIKHSNQGSSNSVVSNDDSQTIDQCKVKFKGQSSMEKCIKASKSNGLQLLLSLCQRNRITMSI